MRYVADLTLETNLPYMQALGLDSLPPPPQTWQRGDILYVGPWTADSWAWLPSWVQIIIVPDGGKVRRLSTTKAACKQYGVSVNEPNEGSKYRELWLQARRQAETWEMQLRCNDTENPRIVRDVASAQIVLNRLRGRPFAFDLETTSLKPTEADLVGLALADADQAWWLTGEALQVIPNFIALLRRSQSRASGVKFDLSVLAARYGLDPAEVGPVWDTQVLAWLLQAGGRFTYQNDLKGLSQRLLGRDTLSYEEANPQTDEDWCHYAAEGDARNSYDLVEYLKPRLAEAGLLDVYARYEQPLIPTLTEMELAGIVIDQAKLAELVSTWEDELALVEAALHRLGFKGRVSADRDIAAFLYGELGLPVLVRVDKPERGSVAAEVLRRLLGQHQAVALFLRLSKLDKYLSTFGYPLQGKDVWRVGIRQTSTKTGRISTSPNAQNWPLEIREVAIAPPGQTVVIADLSQIEPRILAFVSGDEGLREAFSGERDAYISLGLAMGFNRELVLSKEPVTRRTIKAVFLGCWMYGGGTLKAVEIAARSGVRLSRDAAARHLQALDRRYPRVIKWRQEILAEVRRTGEARDICGRRRLIPEINTGDPERRAAAEREAINFMIQGPAASLFKAPMPKAQRLFRQAGGTLRNQVHDELVGTCELRLGFVEELARTMEENDLGIQLKVEGGSGPNWLAAKTSH